MSDLEYQIKLTGYSGCKSALLAVAALHRPIIGWRDEEVCAVCVGELDPFGPGADQAPYPCPTVATIHNHLEAA